MKFVIDGKEVIINQYDENDDVILKEVVTDEADIDKIKEEEN